MPVMGEKGCNMETLIELIKDRFIHPFAFGQKLLHLTANTRETLCAEAIIHKIVHWPNDAQPNAHKYVHRFSFDGSLAAKFTTPWRIHVSASTHFRCKKSRNNVVLCLPSGGIMLIWDETPKPRQTICRCNWPFDRLKIEMVQCA